MHDLAAQRAVLATIGQRTIWGDKAFWAQDLNDELEKVGSQMLTPIKQIANQAQSLVQRDKAADELFSKFVSRKRQPIESLFAWLVEKVDIQRASKVRSLAGLIVHIFGRLAAAFCTITFCP